MPATIERRVATLEALSGDGGDGCPRCRGTLLTIRDAITGELHRASWNGGEISPQELGQRRTETRCPRCGRDLTADDSPVITMGGPRTGGAGPSRDKMPGECRRKGEACWPGICLRSGTDSE
jgi:hypothetical protein